MSRIHPSFHSGGATRNEANTQRVGTTSRVSPIPQTSMTVNNALNSAIASNTPGLDLASLFECPICFDYALPPIMQCQSGHIVCSVCRSKLTSCPTCRGPLENIRNLAMEKLAVNVHFPCKYVTSGCSASLLYNQKLEHEIDCEYRPYSCPCPGASCKWSGPLEQVMNHLLTQHKSITTLQGEDIVFLATDIHLAGAVDWVMMQSCFGHHFMLVLEKQDRLMAPAYGESHGAHGVVGINGSPHQAVSNTATVGPLTSTSASNSTGSGNVMNGVPSGSTQIQQFYAVVQLIGTRKQAEQFLYRLELNGPRRRQCWEATPRSIHDGVQSAIAGSDCLMFDNNVANLFSEHGNLGINVTISLSSAASPNS